MSQESTIICVDNSECMRNGDYRPTRFNCQQEAVRALIHYKLRSNPENAVGLISLANQIQLLSSLMTDDRKLMVRLHSLEINGVARLLSAIKTAYLALKHRKNRNHRQRIIVFVGSQLSPTLDKEKDSFLKCAKTLRKEKVNADFVLFGEAVNENQIISDFVNILNGAEGSDSHLLIVPVGDTRMYDALLHSPICEGAVGAAGGMGGGGGEFGINDEDDPELAMALRISLEEQRLRQQQPQNGAEQPAAEVVMDVEQQQPNVPSHAEVNAEDLTEEQQLEYALRLSMADSGAQTLESQQQSRSPSMALSTPAPTPMETEVGTSTGQGAQLGDLLMQHPEMLKKLVDQIPSGAGEKSQHGYDTEDGKSQQKSKKKEDNDSGDGDGGKADEGSDKKK